jgi:ATP-dependent Clp protease adaptor protein ClpS
MNTLYSFAAPRWQESSSQVLAGASQKIVVWNDDVNTFDWVIESLIDVCAHSRIQAEQCALIIHCAGKYAVKEGSFDALRPQAEALIERGINATIE